MKYLKRLKEKNGMSMVNVLAAFAVLMLILLMFGQAVNVSLNMFRKSEDLRKTSERLFSDFYRETAYDDKTAGGEAFSLQFTQEGGGAGFAINGTRGEYSHTDGGTVWYFGGRKVNP